GKKPELNGWVMACFGITVPKPPKPLDKPLVP
ncbi:hypothetical protein DBR06_SOUSAS6810100, partial [Sousa chinensis]